MSCHASDCANQVEFECESCQSRIFLCNIHAKAHRTTYKHSVQFLDENIIEKLSIISFKAESSKLISLLNTDLSMIIKTFKQTYQNIFNHIKTFNSIEQTNDFSLGLYKFNLFITEINKNMQEICDSFKNIGINPDINIIDLNLNSNLSEKESNKLTIKIQELNGIINCQDKIIEETNNKLNQIITENKLLSDKTQELLFQLDFKEREALIFQSTLDNYEEVKKVLSVLEVREQEKKERLRLETESKKIKEKLKLVKGYFN